MTSEGENGEQQRPSGKRAADASPQQPARRKRGRYTLNACDECKRRKTKCSGESPCQLCKSIGEQCEYSRETGEEVTQKYMNTAIQSLQRQIGELSSIVNSLRNEGIGRPSIENASSTASPKPTQVLTHGPEMEAAVKREGSTALGPTSSSYAFHVLDSTLKKSGVRVPPPQPSAPGTPPPPLTEADAPERYHELAAADDPLTVMTYQDLLRFLRLYEEDLGYQIPHLEVADLLTCVKAHGRHSPTGPIARHIACSGKCYLKPGSDSLIRAIIALMLHIEDHRNRPIAQKLIDFLEYCDGKRFAQDSNVEPDDLSLLVLKALFHFLTDNERLAWRLMGFAARMCMEIGLHRRFSVAQRYKKPSDQRRAIKLFWCIYVLERRWSFGTGLPSAFHDADVDQTLEETDTPSLYLRSMISYCKIAAHVWQATATIKSNTDLPSEDSCSFMEFQVIEWRRSLPPALQLSNPVGGFDSQTLNRGVYRLQMLLYLRANQMLILIHRPYLFSKSGINLQPDKARKAIEWAKDTIRVLKKLHETSNIYSRQHMVFNHFLDSALAMLLLAVCNEPRGTADLVRKEITTALEIVHNLSTRSPISKALWNRLKQYKEVPREVIEASKRKSKSQKQVAQQDPEQGVNRPIAPTSDQGDVEGQTMPTPTMSESSYDPEFWRTYESLFSANAHMLDQLRGNPTSWGGDLVPGAQAQLAMTSPNGSTTWPVTDPSYMGVVDPATGYIPPIDNWVTPGCFGDVSNNLFSF